MKTMALFAVVLGAACTAPDSQTSSATQAATTPPDASGGTSITTELWDPKASDGDKLLALWPADAQTSQILYREGPDQSGSPAYLAFVVYDGAVHHVYWIVKGSSIGSDLKQSWDNAFSTRTNSYNAASPFDHWGGGNGGGGTGNPPSPHPNVFPVSWTWQQQAVKAAAAISEADDTFNQYVE